MRISLTALVVTVGFCSLFTGLALADVRQPIPESTRYTARRGSYNMPDPQPTSVTECDTRVKAAIAAEGQTRTSGSVVYQCITTRSYIVNFTPPPVVLPPVDCVVSAWGAWSDPAWSTCSGGQQSRTVTRVRTIITQPANGGAACPPLTESTTQTRQCSGSATLSWTPPTRNSDGSALTNLAGYRVSHGTSPDALTQTIQISNAGVSSYTISNLAPGTYYFAVRAYTSAGTESLNSNIISKTVQ